MTDAQLAAMDPQHRVEQWRDLQILLRFVNFMARRVKQEIAA
jgi:hypothetical protein